MLSKENCSASFISSPTSKYNCTKTTYIPTTMNNETEGYFNNNDTCLNIQNQNTSGDVIYIAAGTGNTTTASGTYTVFSVPNANEFYTTPSLNPTLNATVGLDTCTLYSSIMYAERFTNGPYSIQNNGDQIKITLNVALD